MRIGARTKAVGMLIAGAALALSTVAAATLAASAEDNTNGNTNTVEYWEDYLKEQGHDNPTCEKFEPIDKPTFEVPEGTWVLLVLKAGSGKDGNDENDVIEDPVSGTAYPHSTGKDISHAILCAADSGPSESPSPSGTPSEPTETPSEPTETPSEPTETPSEPTQTPSEPTETPSEPTETPSEPTETPTPPSETPVPTETPSEAPSETPDPTATPSAPRPGFGTGSDGGAAWPLLAGAGVIGTGIIGTGITLLLKRVRRH